MMKLNRKYALKYLRLLFCLIVFAYSQQTSVVMSQEPTEPITIDKLIRSIKANCSEKDKTKKLSLAYYIKFIELNGVDFKLNPKGVQVVRSFGSCFGRVGVNKLLTVIRENYREPVEILAVQCLCWGDKNPLSVYQSSIKIGYSGWYDKAAIKVYVNEQDITALIDEQNPLAISLRGTVKELNLRAGKNEVVISINGVSSKPYVFIEALK